MRKVLWSPQRIFNPRPFVHPRRALISFNKKSDARALKRHGKSPEVHRVRRIEHLAVIRRAVLPRRKLTPLKSKPEEQVTLRSANIVSEAPHLELDQRLEVPPERSRKRPTVKLIVS